MLHALVAALALIASAATPAPTEALGKWLPAIAGDWVPWGKTATYGGRLDSFRCSGGAQPVTNKGNEFDYPIGTCRELQAGTPLNFGGGEPQTGKVLYDSAHGIALYYSGCCAGRAFVLNSGVTAPPSAVRSADLSAVATSRGIGLGATMDRVQKAYGPAVPFTVKNGTTIVPVLSYTTFKSDPVHSSEPCGQYQTFAFKAKKVYAIEIYTGC